MNAALAFLLAAFVCAAGVSASGAAALDRPGGVDVVHMWQEQSAGYAVPIGVFADGGLPVATLSGPVLKQIWQGPADGPTPAEVLALIAAQLAQDGYAIALDCTGDGCGGFDFRFAVDVADPPDMFVNLRHFRFTTFLRGPAGKPDAAVTVLASQTRARLYAQIIRVDTAALSSPEPSAERAPDTRLVQPNAQDPARGQSADALIANGKLVLDGLVFDSGATRLSAGPYPILEDLASVLRRNEALRIALVGHTDSIGSLESNIRISKLRAQAVRARLIDVYDIDPARLDAEGMGYLAPRASNLEQAGRDANRRVEAIVLTKN